MDIQVLSPDVRPADDGLRNRMSDAATTPDRLTDRELAAWRGLLRVHAGLIKQLDAELEDAHGMPLSSYEVLLHLSGAPEHRLRMRDVADLVLLSRSGLTRLVDRLVRDGLVERQSCGSDGRGAFAVLTPRGLRRLEQAHDTHLTGVRRRFLEHFEDDELDALAGFWDRVQPGAAGTERGTHGTAC
jgi:DNA-binding MarR family transcriptional regulator